MLVMVYRISVVVTVMVYVMVMAFVTVYVPMMSFDIVLPVLVRGSFTTAEIVTLAVSPMPLFFAIDYMTVFENALFMQHLIERRQVMFEFCVDRLSMQRIQRPQSHHFTVKNVVDRMMMPAMELSFDLVLNLARIPPEVFV